MKRFLAFCHLIWNDLGIGMENYEETVCKPIAYAGVLRSGIRTEKSDLCHRLGASGEHETKPNNASQ
jgi:hypothetical protein